MQTTTVLCIDDEISFLDCLADFLTDTGYNVLKASSAEEGLNILTQQEPDIVVCDINMPRLDGISLMGKAQKLPPRKTSAPFIFLTAMTQPHHQIAARLLGGSDFLVKPVSFTVVAAAIEAQMMKRGMDRPEHIAGE